jgi:ribosomal-protein-alanine N-acetyltransferase
LCLFPEFKRNTLAVKLIQTDRLDLHHIEADDLIYLFEKRDDSKVLAGKSFSNPYRVLIDFQGPLATTVAQVRKDPTLNKWFVRWVVLRSTNEIIGSANFHSAPTENGVIEIGLDVETAFQRQGYGKEILQGMWEWVVTEPSVKILRCVVCPTNLASMALITSFGFNLMGEQIVEDNEVADVYEMSADEYRKKFASR